MPIVITRGDLSGQDLRALARRESDGRVRVRLLLICHLLDGLDRDAAARAVGLGRQAGYDWPKRYNADGVAGLRDRPRSGRPPLLDSAGAERFKQRIVDGADVERDGVSALRGLDARRILADEFGADYSLSGTFALMHRLGLSWLDPRPHHPESDAERQAEFRKRRRHNLAESRRRSLPVNESRSGSRTRRASARRTH